MMQGYGMVWAYGRWLVEYNLTLYRMENSALKHEGKQRSHDLLHAIYNSQHEEGFISSLQAHRINQKHKAFQQRLHRNSKTNPYRHYPSLNHHSPFQHPLKQSQHLVKHQNKVEANIELHRVESKMSNFNHQSPGIRSTLQSTHEITPDSYFTPKTREQIVARQSMEIGSKFQHKKYNKQSNFSIKIVCDAIQTRSRHEEHQRGLQSQFTPFLPWQNKENVQKTPLIQQTNFSSTSFQTKCNSFSSFTHCPTRRYGREKQQLVSLDEQTPSTTNNSPIAKANQISGFTRHELFSYYQSLLSFSGSSQARYLTGFQTMLNLMNITTNQATVKQLLTPFIASPSFQQFIDVFQRIVQSSLRESVVDYFQIVLDGKWSRDLCFQQLEQLLTERMSKYHAKEIVDEIYFQLERDSDLKVSVQDIVGLCYRSEDFCAFMRGYCQETQRQRVSLKPRKGKLLEL